MTDKWQWWSGRDAEFYTNGPFETRQDAIDAAIENETFAEVVDCDGKWRAEFYVAEHSGTYFDCAECGLVKESCAGCRESLDPEEYASFFERSRNEEYISVPHPSGD
jgi:hypothetical protein